MKFIAKMYDWIKNHLWQSILILMTVVVLVIALASCSSTVDVSDNATVGTISSSATVETFSEGK